MQKTKSETKGISRRKFTQTAAGFGIAALAAGPLPGRVLGANDRINLAAIGVHGMGTYNAEQLMQVPGVQFSDVCDVDQREVEKFQNLFEDKYQLKLEGHKDFRRVLEKKDVDAVSIATPDHWHALIFVQACEAGKDIYCEKPISHNIVEGRAMVNAAKKFNRVVQIGSWQRSVQHFQDAIDFVRSGKLGTITLCRAWLNSNSDGMGFRRPSAPPEGVDYDFWLGPAPFSLFQENRFHWNWRWWFDFAGGQTADWGVHMIDIVCLAMGDWDPLEISSFGGNFFIQDGRDTPDTQIAIFKFRNFVLHWEVRWGNERGLDGFSSGHGSQWIGRNGQLGVNREKWEVFAEGRGDNLRLEEKPETVNPIPNSHHANFIECMRTRQTPRSDIESMHKTTVLCHLANIAFRTGKKLEWDASREIITNEPAAMDCPQYRREYRAPWKLPVYSL
ncbi:MAG TPA: Gfo/Idh/MocA family oxidoreductase [bacterium]|nr:Gfo/Idh/MocA family oxidoreductase [bacterium]